MMGMRTLVKLGVLSIVFCALGSMAQTSTSRDYPNRPIKMVMSALPFDPLKDFAPMTLVANSVGFEVADEIAMNKKLATKVDFTQ